MELTISRLALLIIASSALALGQTSSVKVESNTGRLVSPKTIIVPTTGGLTLEAGSTVALSGVFGGTPTSGTLNLGSVTLSLGTPASGVLTNCTGLPVSTGISGLGTGAASFLADMLSEDVFLLTEEFIGGTNSSGQIGALGWRAGTPSTDASNIVGDAVGSSVYTSNSTNHSGVYRVTTGATSGNSKSIVLAGSALTQFPIETGAKIRVIFNVNSVADCGLFIGVLNNVGPFSTDVAPATRYFGLRADTAAGDTLFYGVCKDAGSETKTSTTKSFATGWHNLLLEITSATSGNVTLDGTTIALSTNFFTGSQDGYILIAAVTRTASAKNIDVDMVKLFHTPTR